MAMFELQTPDGATYEIEAPDEQSAIDALGQMGGNAAQQQKPLAWSDVPGQALQNAPRSAMEFGKALAQPVIHPIKTAQSIDDLAYGGLANVPGMRQLDDWWVKTTGAPSSYDLPRIGEQMELAGNAGKFYKERYGSTEGLKRALANDPIGVLADASTVLTGGGAALARVPGATTRAIAKGLQVAGDVTNPVKAVTAPVNKMIRPKPASPQQKDLVNILEKEGVDLTAGQKTQSENLRYMESELGGSKAASMMEKQGEQFTGAALKRAGINAKRATPDVVDDAFVRIGKDFDGLSNRNKLIADPKIAQDLSQVAIDYGSVVAPGARAPAVERAINETLGLLQKNGFMDGKAYQHHASRLRTLARKTTDPELKDAINGIVEALDDGMGRSIAKYNPADNGKWAKARREYRNLMVIEQSATGAGQATAMGIITPSQLRQATVTKHGRRNYARGKGDFSDLARAGEGIMKPPPQSGTAPRTWARNAGAAGPAIAGTMIGGMTGDPLMAITGGVFGALAPNVMGRGLMSGPVQNYLSRPGRGTPGQVPSLLLYQAGKQYGQ